MRALRVQSLAVFILGLLCVGTAGATDYIVEVGRIKMIVRDTGGLGHVCVGKRQALRSVALRADCGDKSVKGKGRLFQGSSETGPRGVEIAQDRARDCVLITRKGVLGFGARKDAAAVAYSQSVEVFQSGKMSFDYEIEFLRTLDWGSQPVSVAIEIPMSLAEGASCVMDKRPPRTIPATWTRTAQVSGRFSTLKLAGLELTSGEGVRGSLQDPRSWSRSRRTSYQYVAMYKSRRWFKGVKPIEKGTKWRVAFTIQAPMDVEQPPEQAVKIVPASVPSRPTGPVIFEDDFNRAELGPGWVGGTFAKAAMDRHTRAMALAGSRQEATIKDNALDLRQAGKRGKCTALSRFHGIPARCVIDLDFTLKADDSIGKALNSMFFRSHAQPGTCICLHVDTRRQFFFFEIKHKGRYAGEKLFYYPFRFTFPGRDQKFHFRIESNGDSGLLIWITGGGIPANNMPIALLGGKAWTPFRDGELFFFTSNRENGAVAHCQWDNIRVSELPPCPTINELYYRNKLLVGFRNYIQAPKGARVNVAVSRKDEKKALVRGVVKPVVWDKSRLLLDVSSLAKGDYVVSAEMFSEGGKSLGTSCVDFHKVRDPKLKLRDMTVYIDEKNRIVVNGKPFFPIGVYCTRDHRQGRWDVPDKLFAELKAAGFNTVQSYGLGHWHVTPERYDSYVIPWLNAANKRGLKVFCGIAGSIYPVRRRTGRVRSLTDPFSGNMDPLATTAWMLKKGMKHPGILCWYIGDESIGHGEPESFMGRLNRMVKDIDPNHPTVLATSPGGHRNDGLRVSARVVDISGNDHYPMFRKEPAHAWRKTAILSEDAVDGLQPWWAIPQCYARRYGREMTEAEIYVETYLAIVHGAKGVVWWACYYARRDHPENWQSTKKLATELNRISPILLADDCKDKVTIIPADASVDTLLKTHNGKRYLIAVSYSTKPIPSVTFTVPRIRACRSYFDNRQVKVRRSRSFTDAFAPYERRMYELR